MIIYVNVISSDMGDIIQHWRGDAYIPDHGGGEGSAVPGIVLVVHIQLYIVFFIHMRAFGGQFSMLVRFKRYNRILV